jgi:hypothetical protein
MPYVHQKTWIRQHRRGVGAASDSSGGYTTITTPQGDYQVLQDGTVIDPNGNQIQTAASSIESNMQSGINYLTALLGTQPSAAAPGGSSFGDWFKQNQTIVLWGGLGLFGLVFLRKAFGK